MYSTLALSPYTVISLNNFQTKLRQIIKFHVVEAANKIARVYGDQPAEVDEDKETPTSLR